MTPLDRMQSECLDHGLPMVTLLHCHTSQWNGREDQYFHSEMFRIKEIIHGLIAVDELYNTFVTGTSC